MLYPVDSSAGSQMLIENDIVTFPKSIKGTDVVVIAPMGGKASVRSSDQNKTVDVSISTFIGEKEILTVVMNILADTAQVKDGQEVKEGQPLGKAMTEGLLGIHGSPIHWKAAIVNDADPKNVKAASINPIELGGLTGGLFFADLGAQALAAQKEEKRGFFSSVATTLLTFGLGVVGGLVGGIVLGNKANK